MDMQLFSLEGRTALITGGNGGIGRAMALGLKEAGAQVAVTGRNPEKNKAIAAELGDAQLVFELDVKDETGVERTVREVVEQFGHLDILINNAGTVHSGPFIDLSLEEWNNVIGTNLTGAFLCSKHVARAMIKRGTGGKIINISSIYALFGPPDFADYPASKAGLVGLTRALAVELAPHHIQVNALLPGYFETEMSSEVPGWLRRDLERKTPAGRWGQPGELVGAAVFLASAASDYITGVQLPVDGGYSVADRLKY